MSSAPTQFHNAFQTFLFSNDLCTKSSNNIELSHSCKKAVDCTQSEKKRPKLLFREPKVRVCTHRERQRVRALVVASCAYTPLSRRRERRAKDILIRPTKWYREFRGVWSHCLTSPKAGNLVQEMHVLKW